jgi:NAD(P)-dependent dehydrogenase (short-subunit alcohol dehydrogenase family)
MTKWTAQDIPDQTGRTILITGANSGLGLRSSEALSAKGAHVVMACRNAEKAARALDDVKATATSAEPELIRLDLSDLSSVRDVAAEVNERFDSVDVLMNNAGIMAVPKGRTADGFESQMGTNHLGHFALTCLVLPTLLASGSPRVVSVSSTGHRMGTIHLDDLNYEHRRYTRWGAYGQTKLANLLFTSELQRRATEARSSLLAVAAHPGYAATNLTSGPATGAPQFFGSLVKFGDRLLGQSDVMGALPQLYAATMPDVAGNDYWGPDGFAEQRGHPKRVGRNRKARDAEIARRLWEASERLTGVTDDWG